MSEPTLEVNDIYIDGVLDGDGEVRVVVGEEPTWLNKEGAGKIIAHLQAVFDLGDRAPVAAIRVCKSCLQCYAASHVACPSCGQARKL